MKSQENPRTVSVSRHPKVSWANKSQRTRTFKSQKAFQEPKKVPGFPKVTGHILFGTMSIQNVSGPLKKTFKEPQKSQGYGLPKHHVSSVSGVLVPKIQEVIKYPGVLKSVRGQTKVKNKKEPASLKGLGATKATGITIVSKEKFKWPPQISPYNDDVKIIAKF